jgi:hypothetical protein
MFWPLLLTLLFNQFAFSQIEERGVDFVVSPGAVLGGETQLGLEWLGPADFTRTQLSIMDLVKLNSLHPNNNQIIASKVAFISRRPFDSFTHSKMNNSAFISQMLSSVSVSQKNSDTWLVTNKVKAYGLPFKVSFDFQFKEVSPSLLGQQVPRYFRDEASGVNGLSRERFMLLDMTNFSQLIYRNYSVVYVKEISAHETLVVCGLIAAFDLKTANTFFNYPPFSTTKATMMGNLKSQIMNMVKTIK